MGHCSCNPGFNDVVLEISNIFQLCSRTEDRNGGDTLYVTGLSSRVTERDLEEHFSKEGKVSRILISSPLSLNNRHSSPQY